MNAMYVVVWRDGTIGAAVIDPGHVWPRLASPGTAASMPKQMSKIEFRKYLEKAGVTDILEEVLVSLYDEENKPPNALEYIKNYLGAGGGGASPEIQAEMRAIKDRNRALEAENSELKTAAPPAAHPPVEPLAAPVTKAPVASSQAAAAEVVPEAEAAEAAATAGEEEAAGAASAAGAAAEEAALAAAAAEAAEGVAAEEAAVAAEAEAKGAVEAEAEAAAATAAAEVTAVEAEAKAKGVAE